MKQFTDISQYQRQVHLDFHTSPYISDLATEFDAKEFARTFKRAHVNSVTVFAKCHHGMCYYPTKTGTPHPALKNRDLLGEMIEALHSEGIRAPIYTTIAWEEDAAYRHPEWRQLRKNGTFADVDNSADGKSFTPGRWKFLNYLHPDYQDYIEAHLLEIMKNYPVDGFFLDIVFLHPEACWADATMPFREKHGLLADDAITHQKLETAAMLNFAGRFTKLIQSHHPKASIFYNSPNYLYIDSQEGAAARHELQTHWELESLPSGFWGYYHFPRLARAIGRWGKPWLGMTGRFQKQWGDFGGIKPQPALEYECFRSQALGGYNSVGDQLPPRGTLDPAAYQLIGDVYKQCAEAETFYAGATPLPQVGVLISNDVTVDNTQADLSIEGVVQMTEETHYDSILLHEDNDFANLPLLILPDTTVITPKLRARLKQYLSRGGKLLASYRGGFDRTGMWALDDVPLSFTGEVTKYPTYWRAREDFAPELSQSDRVFYQAGMNVSPGKGLRVLVDRVLPYFKRSDVHYSSHFQTPPIKEVDKHPAVVGNGQIIYFADPIFREYRRSGNIAARDMWKKAMATLIGEPAFGAGLPTTILLSPQRREQDLILTLLHYIPIRKSLDIDMIEERSSFAGEILKMPENVREVRMFSSNEKLPRDSRGGFILPTAKGRLLLEVRGYFKS